MLFLPDLLPPLAGSVQRQRITTIMIAWRGSMEKRVWLILYVWYGYGIYGWSLQRQRDKGLTPKGAWLMISGIRRSDLHRIALLWLGQRSGQGWVGLGFIFSLCLLLLSSGFQDRLGSTVLLLTSLALS